jgi:hypothetical protein
VTATGPIERSRKLRAALEACRDKSASLTLRAAATIFRSRLIVEKARERLQSAKAWRDYRAMPRKTQRPPSP